MGRPGQVAAPGPWQPDTLAHHTLLSEPFCSLYALPYTHSLAPAGREGWEYQDPGGQVQGPFRATQVIKWLNMQARELGQAAAS